MDIEQLGPYRLTRTLGRGGMGTVYAGVNLETGDPAAVKLLPAALADEEGFRERFETEIETLRKLNHPNIVRLLGFGEQQDLLFYAMELVEGNSLEEELRQGNRFGWREVAQIGIETCHALRHAHDRGVIHRDIKPGNLLLSNDGQVKLLDFGIARLFGISRLTGVGSVLGTAEYMAPEQVAGKSIGPRTDLYSLGALFYVLLTRRPLFPADSLPEVLHKQQHEEPAPVRQHAADVPAMFEQIIAQLLKKDPEQRIANATVLERLLVTMQDEMSLDPNGEAQSADATVSPDAEAVELDSQDATPQPFQSSADDLAPTRAATDPQPADATSEGSLLDGANDAPADELTETKATAAFDEMKVAATDQADSSPHGRFTALTPEDLDRADQTEERSPLFSLQTGLLVIALAAVGMTVWYFLQPPSAASLHRSIAERTADGAMASLRDAEEDIDRFIELYSQDPRCDQLRQYKREIDLDRLEQRFRLRARGLTRSENLAPVERTYQEAINLLSIDPEAAARTLQALIDLYDHPDELSGPTGDCLELAKRRLADLREMLELQAAQHLSMLEARLNKANELRQDDPDRARKIYSAIVTLYHDKPWATDYVARARDALANRNNP